MKIKVDRILLQKDKLEAIDLGHVDHIDAIECVSDPQAQLDARELARAFVGYRPSWFVALMRLRNVMVKPFGLRTGSSVSSSKPEPIEVGGKLAFFSIQSVSPTKVVLFAEDSHLDSHLVIDTKSSRVLVITAVRYRNPFGRIYMACIMPFHLLIVRRFAVHAVTELCPHP